MTPVEILNTLEERRLKLVHANNLNYKFTPLVDPDKYDGSMVINNPLRFVRKDEYLIYCIHVFIVNAFAVKDPDMLKGYENAKKKVRKVNSFGRTYDLTLDVGTFRKSITHRIRVVAPGEQVGGGERLEIATWSSLGTYLLVRNFDDFYQWYVREFGELVF